MAARYVLEGKKNTGKAIPITAEGLVRYTVPASVHSGSVEQNLTVRFRVADEIRNGAIEVLTDGKSRLLRKKRIMAPGEMETILLKKEWISDSTEEIVIRTREAD